MENVCDGCCNINPNDRFQAEGAIQVLKTQFKFVWAVVILLIISNIVTVVYSKYKNAQYEKVINEYEYVLEAESGENFFVGGDYYGTNED